MSKIARAETIVASNSDLNESQMLTVLQLGLGVSRNNASVYLSKVRGRKSAEAVAKIREYFEHFEVEA